MSRGRGWVDPFAGIPGRRLFVATPLPPAVIDAVTELVEHVRSQGLPTGARDVRWVRLEGLHLTLRFLGPTAPERIVPTVDAVRAAAAAPGVAPIEAALAGAGTFPPFGRPRVLWIGLDAGTAELASLARIAGDELVGAGWPPDDRSFRPHLTLARSDGIAVGRLVADRLVAALGDRRIPFTLDRLGLYESMTGGGPARYVPVIEVPLGGAPGVGPAVYHRDGP